MSNNDKPTPDNIMVKSEPMQLMPDIPEDAITFVKCVYCQGALCPVCRDSETPGFMVLGLQVGTIHELIQQNKEVWGLIQTLQNDMAEISGLLGEAMDKTAQDLEALIDSDRIIPVVLAQELHREKCPEQYED